MPRRDPSKIMSYDKFIIQRGLTEDEYPGSYEEGSPSLRAAVERIKELRQQWFRAEFRIVRKDSWDGRTWKLIYNEKGERING